MSRYPGLMAFLAVIAAGLVARAVLPLALDTQRPFWHLGDLLVLVVMAFIGAGAARRKAQR